MPPLQHPHTWQTPSLQLHLHTHHTVTPGFVDRRRWSDAGWWTKNGMIGLPPQTRVKGVGRPNNKKKIIMEVTKGYVEVTNDVENITMRY